MDTISKIRAIVLIFNKKGKGGLPPQPPSFVVVRLPLVKED